jgi:hypothetical protein
MTCWVSSLIRQRRRMVSRTAQLRHSHGAFKLRHIGGDRDVVAPAAGGVSLAPKHRLDTLRLIYLPGWRQKPPSCASRLAIAGNTIAFYKISLPPTTISVVAKIGRSTASGTCAEM